MLRSACGCSAIFRSTLQPSIVRSSTRSNIASSSVRRTSHGIRCISSTSARKSQDTQMRMLIVGSPGAGKGTQSGRLQSMYEFNVLSAGDVLRSHIQRGTDIGQRASEVIKSGSLMSDEVMMELIGSEVKSLGSRDWLLDGFPRTLGQAEMLDKQLSSTNPPSNLQLVINLDVPEQVILDRILQRWVHQPSGRVYNLSFNPPKVAGKDDVTGEPLTKRADDNPETFSKRLKSFHNQTQPMLQYYQERSNSITGGITDIDCKTASSDTSSKNDQQHLFVNLRGDTSNQIWPHLLDIVKQRFPNLKQVQRK